MVGPRLSLHFLMTEPITIMILSFFALSCLLGVRLRGSWSMAMASRRTMSGTAGAVHAAGIAAAAAKGYLQKLDPVRNKVYDGI